MTISYRIDPDKEQLSEVVSLFEFLGGNMRDAQRIAINKAGPKIKTLSSRRIREQVRLSVKYVNERIKFFRASRASLNARISMPSRGMLLSRFSTDVMISGDKVGWLKPPPVPDRGIRVKVKPQGPVKVLGGDSEIDGRPFYMVLKNTAGRVGIAGRRKIPGKRGGKIKVFYGPSMSQVFAGARGVKQGVLPEAGEELTYQMADAIRYLLRKQLPSE